MIFQAIDRFCRLADNDEELPPLANGKKWANYLLTGPEWDIIKLAQDCLVVCYLLFTESLVNAFVIIANRF